MTFGLAIGSIAAPWGPVRVAASERGIVAMENLVGEDELAARLERRFGAGALGVAVDARRSTQAAHLRRALAAVAAFAEGDLNALADLPLDVADRSAFDRTVFEAVRALPPGVTASYAEVARMIGKPGAARAVGGAVARCPIGLAIPCHRVIAADGSLGGYGGGWWGGRDAGLELKRELLAREGVHLSAGARERD